MDDSSLKSLAIVPKSTNELPIVSLQPEFDRLVKVYSCAVGSSTTAIQVRAVTNEADSFFQVAKADSEQVVSVREGINDIEVKVEAPDGSSSVYIVSILRPPATDATLETAPPLDLNAHVSILSPHPDTKPATESGRPATVGLYLGDSPIEIEISSSNGAVKKKVYITARREKPAIYPSSLAPADLELVCSVCTCNVFRPRKHIPGDNAACTHRFCLTCLDLLTDSSSAAATHDPGGTHAEPTTTTCPLCPPDAAKWGNNPLLDPDPVAETRIASLRVPCPFERFGCKTADIEARLIADHVAACAFTPGYCAECGRGWVAQSELEGGRHKVACTTTCDCGVKIRTHERELHALACPLKSITPVAATTAAAIVASAWELAFVDKKLVATSSVADCIAAAETRKALYATSLADAQKLAADTFGQSTARPDLQLLTDATGLYATAIAINAATGSKAIDASLHVLLGLVLEEAALCDKHFPAAQASRTDRASQLDVNAVAADSFMMDEVNGLLDSLGVPKSASDAVKIREIEAEYTRLNALGLSDEAAEVMGLHAFLVKKVAAATGTSGWNDKAGEAGEGGLDGNTNLNTTYAMEKYRTAVQADPKNSEANFYLGRQLILSGCAEEAVQYLRTAVGLKPLWKPARTLLGLALATTHKADAPIPALAECIQYLSEAIDEHRLCAPQPVSAAPHFLTIPDTYSQVAMLHLALARAQRLIGQPLAASQTLSSLLSILPDILRVTPSRAPHAASLAAALSGTLAALLRILGPGYRRTLLTTCLLPTARRLAERFPITDGVTAATATANIARALVWASPRNPTALAALGHAQLEMFDACARRGGMHAAGAASISLLDEAEQSFCAAVEAEAGGEFPSRLAPGKVSNQAWWNTWKDEDAAVKAKVAAAAVGSAASGKKEVKPAVVSSGGAKAPVRKGPLAGTPTAAAGVQKQAAGGRAGPVGTRANATAGKGISSGAAKAPVLASAAKAPSSEKLQNATAPSMAAATVRKAGPSVAGKLAANQQTPIKPLDMARKPVLPAIKPKT
ncbi:hypothetical protein HDU86_000178 [Geranomyces michiganensis]|nr:hypothetical protein HDU86_000178 [Geranomyces michiganensis]